MIYSYILEFKAVIDQAHFEFIDPFTGANLPNRANCAGAFIPGHVPRPRQGALCLRDRCKNSPAGTVAHWWNMERKNEHRPPRLKDIESTCWQITRQEHGNGEPGPESTLTSVKLCKSQAVAASCFCGKPYIDVLLRAWGRGVLRGGDSKRPPNAKEAWPDQRVRLLQSRQTDVKVTQLCTGLLMKKRSPVPQCGDLVLSRPSFGKRCVLRTVLWIVSHPKGVGTTTDMWWPSNDLIIWSNSMCKLHHTHTNIFSLKFPDLSYPFQAKRQGISKIDSLNCISEVAVTWEHSRPLERKMTRYRGQPCVNSNVSISCLHDHACVDYL